MPFAKDLAPSMLHTHRSHAEAVARVGWCVAEAAIGLVTGEVGAGKTVACAPPWPASTPAATPSSISATRRRGTRPVRQHRVHAGRDPHRSPGFAHPSGPRALATEEDQRGRKVVLVLDEAHLLDAEQLEGLRLLSGVDMDRVCLSPASSSANPPCAAGSDFGAFRRLDQRIALRYAMAGMDPAETASYITHHLKSH